MGQSLRWVWALRLARHNFWLASHRGYPGPGLSLPGPAGKGDLIWIQGLPQLSRKTQEGAGQGLGGRSDFSAARIPDPHSSI